MTMTVERATRNPVELDPELAATMAVEQLEAQQDRTTLAQLAAVYTASAEGVRLYSYVLVAAARLRESRLAYDRHLRLDTSAEIADQLRERGIALYEPAGGDSPNQLREDAAITARLARECQEAAAMRGTNR